MPPVSPQKVIMSNPEKLPLRRTQEERRQEAEEALLTAATELIAEQGVQQTSFVHIGERAGYSRGLASHYFDSKEAMIDAIARRLQDRFHAQVGDVVGEDGLGTLLRTADAFIDQALSPSKDARAYLVLWTAGLRENGDNAPFIEADRRTSIKVAALVEIGKNDGSISKDTLSSEFAEICLALIRGVAIQVLKSSFKMKPAEVKKQLRAMIRGALSQ